MNRRSLAIDRFLSVAHIVFASLITLECRCFCSFFHGGGQRNPFPLSQPELRVSESVKLSTNKKLERRVSKQILCESQSL